ncbi:MAG: phosphoribosylformylglycinamidine synthase subunit PurS [Chitinophagales bacterium]|jgi:phosphoribosylformylglycinamidine synthase PurS subunit|nr:phosphoribosylformylglycinamidine synthase subunit PurS [Sphingobacteriales bacterium]
MKFIAEIKVMPHRELLDPQGKAVNNGLHKMNLNAIQNVRIGKNIELHLEAASKEDADKQTKEACEKLLVNKIMEQYSYTLSQLEY